MPGTSTARQGFGEFDLDVTTVQSAPVVANLLRGSSDGCTTTCDSACSNSTCN